MGEEWEFGFEGTLVPRQDDGGLTGWMFHVLLDCWALGMGFRSLR